MMLREIVISMDCRNEYFYVLLNNLWSFPSLVQVIFTDFKVVNVLAVCNMPFEIRLPEFTKNNRPHAR